MATDGAQTGVFVMKELSGIRGQLKCQLQELLEKEKKLREREIAIAHRETMVETARMKLEKKAEDLTRRESLLSEVEGCVATCYASIEDCIAKEIQQGLESSHAKLESNYQCMKKENMRLKDGLTSTCRINEKLKAQLEADKVLTSQMKKQVSALQARVSCLKIQHSIPCKQECPEYESNSKDSSNPVPQVDGPCHIKQQGDEEQLIQLVHSLIGWISKALPAVPNNNNEEISPNKLYTSTFSLLGVLLPKMFVQQHRLVCLQYICQVLLSIDCKTKSLLASSLRRISDVCVSYIQSKHCNSECRMRVLSCLVLLQTTTQMDVANLALQCLKCDLMTLADVRREFITFGGISHILPYLSSSPKLKVLCTATLDIYILLSSDSGLEHFLNDQWFKAVASLLSEDIPLSQLEKLSILLQRLSTFRQSKMLFTRSEIVPQLCSLSTSKNELTSFIHMNISSTLNNIQNSVFQEVVSGILADWPALQIAVENSFGGVLSREKAEWLVEVMAEFIQINKDVSSAEINERLGLLMDQEFNTVIEDGSLDTIAERLHDLWIKFEQGHVQERDSGSGALAMGSKEEVTEKVIGEVDATIPGGEEEQFLNNEADSGWTVVKRKH